MPAHFGKYNYAICRRLSRSALMKRVAQQQQQRQQSHDNGTDTNGNSTAITNGGDKSAKTKNKKKDKRSKSPIGDSIELNDVDKSNTVENGNIKTNGNGTSDHYMDYEKANEELNNFIATLRMLNIDVIELCPDDELEYDSVFIGDTAVTVNGLVLLCRPRNRLSEINEIKQIIKSELNLPIIEIKDESALLNGGDVLWTGREIFVGLSTETNEAGARAVAAAFPEYSVTPVKVPNLGNGNKSTNTSKKPQTTNEITTGLMLKSYITMAGPDILCINRSQEASSMLRRMEREASYNYKLITLDDERASNVLYLNGTLIHRNDLPESVSILQEKIDYSRVPVKISELTRDNPYHGLDSLCLLVRKSHRIQTIV